jgi:hypothetical protein
MGLSTSDHDLLLWLQERGWQLRVLIDEDPVGLIFVYEASHSDARRSVSVHTLVDTSDLVNLASVLRQKRREIAEAVAKGGAGVGGTD